ncbi:uncharacterized protein SAPINGB_P004255 [Magnusiomyces paraingens]|uniref:Cytochrome P450 n=1 Tax=Magnusiomyces paraingens TaxID=2606893 RepID=A0A5E8BTI4_9ASCO|nr:uncharacterized protein SAPINGB_P004255 [Saprochaete ingens]VVT54773.1 unnamed protein product [Saprochaete ingens]
MSLSTFFTYTTLAGPLILAALFFLVPVYQDLKYRFQVWCRKSNAQAPGLPPTIYSIPFGIPFFIDVLRYSKKQTLMPFIQKIWHSKQTATIRLQTIGEFDILTSDPENIKAILAVDFKDYNFGHRHGAFEPLLGDGIFTLEGAGWKHSRAMLRPQFTRQMIAQLDSIERHVLQLISVIQASSGENVDLQALFFKLTIDTATEFLFGESVQTLSGGNPKITYARNFDLAFNSAQAFLARRFRLNIFYKLADTQQFREWCTTCKSFTDSYVQLALERADQKQENGEKEKEKEKERERERESYVFLDELVKETRDPQVLRDQALNILLAGRDSTASLLSWIFYNLAIYPAVFTKLRAEILTHFGTTPSTLSFESLKQCKYLRYVIDETLRLYPIVPANARAAVRDTYLPRGGLGPDSESSDPDARYFGTRPVFIPKGTILGYSVYVLHRDPHFWGG